MNLLKYLLTAGVPKEFHGVAIENLKEAKILIKGLVLAKWKVRLFKAGKISKILSWKDERLIDVRPDLADWDIAPMINITAHGDNSPWEMTPEGGRPLPGRWLDTNPSSEEYKQAVEDNYWCKGKHPRSKASRKAWYRRNAGEYAAWSKGMAVNIPSTKIYRGNGVTVYECSGAWLVKAEKKLLWRFGLSVRVGFEIDNLQNTAGEQSWYPIPGYELRAPVTWSILPKWLKK